METWEKLQKIADAATPSVKQSFIEAIRGISRAVPEDIFERFIRNGDWNGAWKSIKWDKLFSEPFSKDLANSLSDIVSRAGPEVLKDLVGVEGSFDVENPHVYQYIDNTTGTLVTNISNQTRDGIKVAVREAFLEGKNPPKQKIFTTLQSAANIHDSLGLTTKQYHTLQKYKTSLANRGVTGSLYTKLVTKFRDNQIRYRADQIARTETNNAASEAQRIAWDNAVQSGFIDSRYWEVEWVVTPDDILCPMCITMKNKRRPLDGIYTEGKGAGNRGPTLHPYCRCTERLVRKKTAEAKGKKIAKQPYTKPVVKMPPPFNVQPPIEPPIEEPPVQPPPVEPPPLPPEPTTITQPPPAVPPKIRKPRAALPNAQATPVNPKTSFARDYRKRYGYTEDVDKLSLDDVIERGTYIRREVQRRFQNAVSRLERQAEQRYISTWEQKKVQGRIFADTVKEVHSELRKIGGKMGMTRRTEENANFFSLAEEYMPKDWLDFSRKNRISIKTMRNMGRYSGDYSNWQRKIRLLINSSMDDIKSTALHEFNHFVEHRIKGIMKKSFEFIDRRSPNQPPIEFDGGFVGKPDKFYREYAGRQYGYIKRADGTWYLASQDSTEVLTCGMQGLFTRYDKMVKYGTSEIDWEYIDFVNGILGVF